MLILVACGSGDIGRPAVSVPPDTKTITFPADDGVELEGLLYGNERADAVLVLAHQRGGRKESWNDFAIQVAEEGFAAFAFDFRGYGRTEGDPDTHLVEDLDSALQEMRARGFDRAYVVGASMGGTAALTLAGQADFAGVVAISAPRSFAGVTVDPAAIEEPVLLVYAVDDEPYSSDGAAIAEELDTVETLAYPGEAHGTQLLGSEAAGRDILRFFAMTRDPAN